MSDTFLSIPEYYQHLDIYQDDQQLVTFFLTWINLNNSKDK